MSVPARSQGRPRPIRLTIAAQSDRGLVRAENQDDLLVADLSAEPGSNAVLTGPDGDVVLDLGPRGLLAVVADGMGGAAAGALASRRVTHWILEFLTAMIDAEHNDSPRHFAERLEQVVRDANARVYQESRRRPEHHGMGSTATAAGILDDSLFLVQVGDSRAYLIRGGAAFQLTRDQSLVQQLIDAGTMTEEEAERSPQRHILIQAMGTEPDIRPDLTYQELRAGDAILLCSDGLHGIVDAEEIAARITGHAPAAACAALIELANSRGGPDNITAIVIGVEGRGLAPPAAEDAVGRQPFR